MSKENNRNEIKKKLMDNNGIPSDLKEESKESDENINNNKVVKEKIPELKNFDFISHFKENINHFDKNCSDPIKDYSYYCFTCKHSVCNECGVVKRVK